MRTINSLPDRPLTVDETDALVESGKFVPLGIMQTLPPGEEVEFSEDAIINELLEDAMVNRIVSLLHAKEDVGVTLAYSERKGGWVKAVEMPADEYDRELLEQETHDFVIRHSESSIDEDGFTDVENYK
jgi:hypothetical protein